MLEHKSWGVEIKWATAYWAQEKSSRKNRGAEERAEAAESTVRKKGKGEEATKRVVAAAE